MPTSGRQNFNERQLHTDLKDEHTIIKPAKRTEELAVHPSLNEKDQWNHSTTFDRADDEKRAREAGKQSLRHSRKKNKKLDSEGYLTPVMREAKRMAEIRAARQKKNGRGGNSLASPRQEAPKRADNDDEPSSISQFKRKTPSRKYKEYYNDGVYEYSKIEERMVWSCSMNPNPEFRGSCYKVRNPEAWNWASP